jgi:hypothetical protein
VWLREFKELTNLENIAQRSSSLHIPENGSYFYHLSIILIITIILVISLVIVIVTDDVSVSTRM